GGRKTVGSQAKRVPYFDGTMRQPVVRPQPLASMMGRADRLFEIIDPARWAIASAQAPGDLELAPKTLWRWERERNSSLANPTGVNPRIRVNHGRNYTLFSPFWARDLITAAEPRFPRPHLHERSAGRA